MADRIKQLLRTAYTSNASDLHITVDSPPVLRVHGKLMPLGDVPLTGEDTLEMAKAVIKEDEWNHFLRKGELDFSYELPGISRFRMNVYRQRHHVGLVARVVPNKIPTLEELNMPHVLRDLALKPHGLFLVTGPTGSGKSTTLAAMIDFVNQNEAKHIITLEDPIEYIHTHKRSIVNQREVGVDTESFANGLRASLRQDPDIILVGEMRDHETMSTAITAAETGHLVLATLHTNSAVQTINRIIDVFPPHQQSQIRVQLSSVLVGILSQRLFPTMDGTGRAAATEILINIPAVANLIRNEKVDQIHNILQTSRALGMHTLETSIKTLLNDGKIDSQIARNYLNNEGDV